MIPLYVIEEHNEAFCVWNEAVEEGVFPAIGNALLHVDHHPDFECGPYGENLDVLFASLSEMKQFAGSCLGIADFICPAVYQGMFQEIVFLRNFLSGLPKPEWKVMYSAGGALVHTSATSLLRGALKRPDADHRFFSWREGGLAGDFRTPQPVVLDIDLDYFCWDDSRSGMPDDRLEITENAYRSMQDNPYHPFRLLPKMIAHPVEEGGRYYLRYFSKPDPDPLPSEDQVCKRIDAFAAWLTRNQVRPRIISICRSRYSGYTPAPMWQAIETRLLERLAERYDYVTQS